MLDNTKNATTITYNGEQIPVKNLSPENVRKDVNILGTIGEMETGGDYDVTFEMNEDQETQTVTIIETAGAGEKTTLLVAEMPNVTLTLTKAGTTIETKNTGASGGIIEFSVGEAGTYNISASGTDITSWNKDITITELNKEINVYAGDLDNYTPAQIHIACQGGFAHNMFEIGALNTFHQTGSMLDGQKKFIEDIVTIDGKDYIDWRFANKADGTYNINPQFGYLTSSSATSWLNTYSSNGGEKYSAMQQRFMLQGEAVYSQAQGILPDNYSGTLTTGIKMSEIYYTDQNGAKSKLYNYDRATDTFAEATSATYANSSVAKQSTRFVKGYFKSVGTIDEPTFNAGYYYTYNDTNFVYTRATTYTSGTTYYGFYETLQENGVFYDAISSLSPYLVKRTLKASAGTNQTTYLSEFEAYVNLPCIENMFGVNRNTTLKSGTASTNAGAYNLVGEGSRLKVYDDWSYLCIGSEYWTRSTNSNPNDSFCTCTSGGGISSKYVYTSNGVRVGFRTC